ncbi:MAG: hypothetical protein WCH42_07435, partial [Actinomycetes bacterium]
GQRLGWNFALTSPLSGALLIRSPAGEARAINCSRISGIISVNKSKGEVIPTQSISSFHGADLSVNTENHLKIELWLACNRFR